MSTEPPGRALIAVLVAEPGERQSAGLVEALDGPRFDVATYSGDVGGLVAASAAVQVVVIGPTASRDGLAAAVPRLLGGGARLLVVSETGFDDTASSLLFAGATGFLSLHDAGPDDLAEAVVAISRGSTALNPDIVHEVLLRWRERRAAPPRSPELSGRETEVLQALCQGLTLRLIAKQLGVAEKTVEAHKSRLFAKLGARNQAQAVRIAVERGLVD